MQLSAGLSDHDDAAHPDAQLAAFILALRSRGVRSKDLMIAFEKTPRSVFLPKANPNLLYAPYALPLECGAEATAPHLIAQVLNALALAPGMSVLEIGTGSGFQTAILARFGCRVVTVERFLTLHIHAARALKRLSLVNLRLEHGDGREGFAEGGPYDRIIINGAVDMVPDALVEQLAPGGTIIAPIQTGRAQRLYAFDDAGENFNQRDFGRSTFQRLAEGRALAL